MVKNLEDFLPRAHHTSRGFTFIELLVVMAVMGTLVVLTATTMRNLTDRQQYEAEVNEVARSISEQRTKAISSYDDRQYGVRVTAGEIAYFSSTTPDFDPTQTSSTTLGHTVARHSFSDSSDALYFSRITGTPSATGTIALYSVDADATTTITIYASGSIVQE